ncbi:lipid phosphate phosphatase 1 [Auriscalpium vulgare]|uniref:Lipid phosphate phosphatase 1 n=1 Tax=Auriscalpium vulgare TaxID=40419 RepID=A0ACB8RE65_9AGAM|nr:lipid phosphate phosphatase 1 [Auriscalpium vulgare]
MAHVFETFKRKIKELYGEESLEWWDRSYIVDWLVATAVLFLAYFVEGLPVFERDFKLDDPLISHPHTHQRISGHTNVLIALVVPMTASGIVGGARSSVVEIHHGILAAWSGRALNSIITEALKNRVGRLRPDFLARCAWDAAAQACTGNAGDITDGRRSFPSGHSSTAFTGMTFLTLFIAGKTASLCFSVPGPPRSILGSRLVRLMLTLSPLAWATWVAISRVEDYRHHKEDVIVGSTIGAISAAICYLIFWPSPFAAANFRMESTGRPRLLYQKHDLRGNSRDGYELTGLEHDVEAV